MANRTNAPDVKVIFETDLPDATVTAFITTANHIVTDQLASSISDSDLLEDIEKWLAAHLAATRDQRIQRQDFGDSAVTFQGKTGLGLDATQYGQHVKLLDTTGKLARLGQGRVTAGMIDPL